jgi:hypothetical protein
MITKHCIMWVSINAFAIAALYEFQIQSFYYLLAVPGQALLWPFPVTD